MDHKALDDAALENDVTTLHKLLEEDPLILKKATLNCKDMNPLHIAAMFGNLEFVKEILRLSPDMCFDAGDRRGRTPLHLAVVKKSTGVMQELINACPSMCLAGDQFGRTPLHLAVIQGTENEILEMLIKTSPSVCLAADRSGKTPLHLAVIHGAKTKILEMLIEASPSMCLAVDRSGRTPLHLAVIQGAGKEILEMLTKATPLAARQKTEGGGNVLHLCVKHNQLDALEWFVGTINDKGFVNGKDDEGMTVLHLAICSEKTAGSWEDSKVKEKIGKTIAYLVNNKKVSLNAKNADKKTALDLSGRKTASGKILTEAGAQKAKSVQEYVDWLSEKRGHLMVVASLMAAMAFQADRVRPTVADLKKESEKLVPSPRYHWDHYYGAFIQANSVAFVASLSTILLLISGLPFTRKYVLWTLMVIMWLTITALALSYGFLILLARSEYRFSLQRGVIGIGVVVWCGLMSLVLLGNTIQLIKKIKNTEATKRLKTLTSAVVKGNTENEKALSYENC